MENGQAVADALRQGDKQVLGQLFDQYAPALFGLAIRLTESEQHASDVLKAVFQKMVQTAGSFDANRDDLFSWAIQITKNLALEMGSQNNQFDFYAYQSSHEVGADLQKLTKDLDKKHRQVIEHTYFEGLSENEVESAMNIPVGTVNTRLRFAIRELRKALK